ncbi:MAG: Acetylglutamate kinase (EC [uncultured Campylobacterales bacterium]|uniref:Acetylglutamate kinase n=1 Tax=uncultured Campylobacterales bacterium TaxID=352960 RepID=A0A6S6SC91_9BACT|nr:MAG: Acetylglutamate kinase (EC [uncultured Campylobacterales bacterium]
MITEKIRQAKTLLDALPYIQEFKDKIFVIKYGGSAWEDQELKQKFTKDIVLLYMVGIKPVLVHGGSKKISSTLEKVGLKSEFIDGLRVTSKEVLEVVEMVLSGNINKEITTMINNHGAKAIGISGKDANFLVAKQRDERLGFVGRIDKVDISVVQNLIREQFIPVIAPIASSYEENHPGFNINADLAASKIASELKAEKVIFMTDIKGVLNKNKELIPTLNENGIASLKADGTIHGGMIPKVEACLECVKAGVKKAHIIDGKIEHSLLLEVFTKEGVGTVIKE